MIAAAALIVAGSSAAALGVGAWLKWATLPVVMAYEIGRAAERVRIGAGRRWRPR